MTGRNIYVWNKGNYDNARWVTLGHRGPETCVLQLSDLCQPGMATRFNSVTLPTAYLKAALSQGALQVTLPGGFLLVWSEEEIVHIDFKGFQDGGVIHGTFLLEDFIARIDSDKSEAGRFAARVRV